MKADRSTVYCAIDSERSYQETLKRNELKEQAPLEHLSIIRTLARRMDEAFYEQPGQPPMDYMRKIAAVAVRCMEQHGAPFREVE